MGSLIKETPFSEIVSTIEWLDQLGLTRDDLRTLRKSGALRRDMLKVLRDPVSQESFTFTVGDGRTARDLLDACKFDQVDYEPMRGDVKRRGIEEWVDGSVPKNDWHPSGTRPDYYEYFPLEKEPGEVELEIVDFRDYRPTEEQVLMEFRQRGLIKPKPEDALRFALNYPDECRKKREGHSPWHSRTSFHGIIFFTRERYQYAQNEEIWLSTHPEKGDRRIELNGYRGEVPPGWVFAARRPKSKNDV